MNPAGVLVFAFFLQDLPAGEVRLSDENGHYEYTAVHRFLTGSGYRQRTFTKSFTLDKEGQTEGRVPVSRWLARRPENGCRDAVDERTGEAGRVCAKDDGAQGTVFGRPFQASFEDGVLSKLTLGSVRFIRGSAPLPNARPASEGFAIDGHSGPLALEPAVPGDPPDGPAEEGARALSHAVHHRLAASGTAPDCVAYARALVGELAGMQLSPRVVYGLVEDGGRAFPHTWVRVTHGGRSSDVDPALERTVTSGRYLALTSGAPGPKLGAVYLDLVEGRRRVTQHVIR